MTTKEHFDKNVLEYFNIKEYFDKGYKGKGIVVASIEGTIAASHGENVKETVLTYAPECTFISYNDTHEISATSDNGVDVNFPNFAQWCIDNKVDIVTSSLDWTCQDYREIKAIKDLYDAGIIFLNSAGNSLRLITRDDIRKTWDFDKEVISVGGITFSTSKKLNWSTYTKGKGSNYGSAVDICTIGSYTPTHDLKYDKWYSWSGTSAATPMAAGMLATYKSFNRKLDSKTVWNIINKLTKTIEYNGYTHKILTLPEMEESIMEEKDWKEEFDEVWARATKLKVVDGTRPNETITRNELVVILDRLGLIK